MEMYLLRLKILFSILCVLMNLCTSVQLSAESLVFMIVNGVKSAPTAQTVEDNFLGIGYQNITEHWTQV